MTRPTARPGWVRSAGMDDWAADDEFAVRGLTSAEDPRVALVRRVADGYRARGLLDGAGRRVRLSADCVRGVCRHRRRLRRHD
jgi:hypothetical protein